MEGVAACAANKARGDGIVEGIGFRSGIWNACARERKREECDILCSRDAVAMVEVQVVALREDKSCRREKILMIAALCNLSSAKRLAA